MFCKKLLLFLLLMPALYNYGQTYPYKQFTTSNGLINNRCGNVSQDSAGYIWITSDNGICNYDGRKFTFFPGKNSTYYFAHTNTINMYKGQCVFATDREGYALGLANKLSFHSPPSDQSGFKVTYGLILDDSTTLVASIYTTTLELISGGRKIVLNPPAAIAREMKSFLMFLKDAEGNIWIGTDAGIYIYQKGNFNAPYILPALLKKYCNVLKADFEGNIFIAAQHDVYKIFREHLKDIKNSQPVKFAVHKENITAMGFSRNGDIMVSNLPDGVAVYDKALQLKKKLIKHGLPEVILWDIFTDREDNIWFATENGVYRFSNFDFVNYIPVINTGTPNIRGGIIYKNQFIFSNNLQFFTLKNEELQAVKLYRKNANYDARVISTPGSTLWLNSYLNTGVYPIITTKLFIIQNGQLIEKKIIEYHSDPGSVIDMEKTARLNNKEFIFITQDKKLFIGHDDWVEKIRLPVELDTLLFNAVGQGFSDNEFVLAVNKIGLFYCKAERIQTIVQLKIIEKIPFVPTLQNDRCVKIVTTYDKEIWLATRNNGIRIFSKENNSHRLSRALTEPEISSNLITELLCDSTGNIWIGSNKGIDKISLAAQPNLNINKGLFNNLMDGRYVYFLKEFQHKLYIGTTGSLSVADINPKLSTTVPSVLISHLSVNNANADSLLDRGTYNFSPNENNLTFEFVSPTFIDEQATEYQYQLKGIDKDWSTAAANYTIAYSQLPPGDYTFKVRAKNANGVWSLTDATFSFTIKKPFYKHWLFFLLCAAVIAAVFFWLYKQKMNRIIAVERTRRSISKDLHDDIGTTLSSITLMNAVLKNKIESQPEEAKEMAAKIETTSRDMIQNMSDIVWSINPNNDTMEKLIYRLQQFCTDVFDKPGIQYQLTADEEIKSKVLSMQLRRDIFLICKEIINNAAKYSKATSFGLSLSLKQKVIVLVASDDGIGFNENTINKGNGLMNIRQRVNTYNGDVSLTSINGTTWQITIPT
jgi:signal transduction histidine kinase/ligand-binding sensor domain-containing protein